MYYVSPFTYLVQGILAIGVANTNIQCTQDELLRFTPPTGRTCGQYMQAYISYAGGYLANPDSTSECQFCTIQSTNVFLEQFKISYADR